MSHNLHKNFQKLLQGYQQFRNKYASGESSLMQQLAKHGQNPDVMLIACSDSRVDPAILLQCDPGDLFVVRNVANLVPPFENDGHYHGTSAALEFGVCYLHVEHLIILGHSQCGGIQAKLSTTPLPQDDFITQWMGLAYHDTAHTHAMDVDTCAQQSLLNSYHNCLTFPWIKERVDQGQLTLHLWFFDIKQGKMLEYHPKLETFSELDVKASIP
jgi:carbonic anhydrase